jgi:hypothetical protein
VIADHQRRRGREIFLREIGDLYGPSEFASVFLERYEMIVGRLKE